MKNSTFQPSNLPTFQPSNLPTFQPSNLPTFLLSFLFFLTFQTQLQAQCIEIDPAMTAAPSCAPKTGYNLIFQDDFNSFNSSVWDKSSVGDDVGDYSDPAELCDLTNNTPMNITNVLGPTDGMLDLRVQEGEEMDACDYSGAEIKTFNNNGAGDSYRDWKVPPNSYVETRVKVPQCDGVGAAFWLYGGISNRTHEIDVFEHDPDDESVVKSNIHYGLRGGSDTDNFQDAIICNLNGQEINIADQFLTFGIELTNSDFKMYVNGVIYQHYQYWPYAGSPLNSPVPYNIRLQGASLPGIDPSQCGDLPQYFKVDYVRVYQKAGSMAVNFLNDTPGKITLCVDNSCHGKDFCEWVHVNYFPGATYEWEPSPFFSLANESATSEDVQKYRVWVENGTLPGDYQLKLKVSFPCSGYQEDLTLNVTVIDDVPPTPYYISLFTDDDYHYYPGTTIADNTWSYEWCSIPCKEVPNPPVGNKNIWGRYFVASYEPREETVCVRARNACGFSPWFCQTLTVPAIEDPCSPCPRALLPPREILFESIPSSTNSYRFKVEKSPYSQSYDWSLDQEYWHNVANAGSDPFNYYSPFGPGLDSFEVFVRARNQDTVSTIFSQKVATPDEPPLPKLVANTYPVVNLNQPFEIQDRGEFEQPSAPFDSYMLYNMMGQVVRNDNWANFSLVALKQELSPGMYVLVKFSADSANRNVTKLLITR